MSIEFPLLYEDELLLSGCARYYDRMSYADASYARLDLFGRSSGLTFSSGLPVRVGVLAQRLPRGYPEGGEDLVQRHTFLPYYAPFLATEYFRALFNSMVTAIDVERRSRTRAALRQPWGRMHYCPVCVHEDRERTQGRECYWCRLHQAPGVLVCARHHTWLEQSSVRSSGIEAAFISAERAELSREPRDASSSPWYTPLETIARESAVLLSAPVRSDAHEVVPTLYPLLLQTRAYLTPTGKVRTIELVHDMIQHFSPDLLIALGWRQGSLARDLRYQIMAMRHPRVSMWRRFYPLLGILVACYLGQSVSVLLEEQVRRAPKPAAPMQLNTTSWPCANPFCGHYRVPTEDVRLLGRREYAGRVIERFTCSTCGHRWTLSHVAGQPGASPKATVVIYGRLWEAELRRLWQDPSQTIYRIAERLEVTESTVVKHAAQLGLRTPRNGAQHLRIKGEALHLRVKAHRAQLQGFRRRHPAATRSDLHKQKPGLYNWFTFHDRPWFDRHFPPQAAPSRRSPKLLHLFAMPTPTSIGSPAIGVPTDIVSDTELAHLVRETARQMAEEGRRSLITWKSLCGRIPDLPATRRQLADLALTAAAVQDVVETGEQAIVRRITMLGLHAARKGSTLTRPQLLKQAAAYAHRNRPAVQRALQAALDQRTSEVFRSSLGRAPDTDRSECPQTPVRLVT